MLIEAVVVGAGVQTVKKSTGGATAAEEQDDASEKGPSADEQLPACIVMEKGECLVEYLARNKGSVMLEDQQFGLRVCFTITAATASLSDFNTDAWLWENVCLV